MGWILNRTELNGGLYRGFLTGEEGDDPPTLEIILQGEVLGHLTSRPGKGGWEVEGDLGTAPLTAGVQTVSIRTRGGDVLDRLTVLVGLDPERDMRAELDALRVEVAQLKQAFRRHMRDSE